MDDVIRRQHSKL